MDTRRLLLAAGVLAGAACLAGCGPTAYKITPVPVDRSLEETVVIDEGGFLPAKIALIDVEGILMNQAKTNLFGEGENPVSLFVEKLDKAAADPRVRAVVLRINSPGGAVTAADIMYTELQAYKRRTQGKVPVVAVMMDVAASGGYYIACAADEIVAHPTTITGSIGVIMQTVNFSGTMAKIGVSSDAITSGQMKDAGSPLRPMKPDERAVFQGMVDQMFERFVQVVDVGRPGLNAEQVRSLADGRVYTGTQAVELGFVDRVDTLKGTLAKLKEQIGAKRVRVVTYQRPLGWKPNVYAEAPNTPPQMNLINITVPEAWLPPTPQFLYLWAP